MKKRVKKKRRQNDLSESKINQPVIATDKPNEPVSGVRAPINILKSIRNDHRIPAAANLNNGQLNFDGPLSIGNERTTSAEEIFD